MWGNYKWCALRKVEQVITCECTNQLKLPRRDEPLQPVHQLVARRHRVDAREQRRRRGRHARRRPHPRRRGVVEEALLARVRPAVAQDGGDIVFHGFDRGVVYLHLRGACSGCPSSIVTLKNGIENLLKYYVPEVVEVRAIS